MGRCYEDFQVGMVIRHPLGRTLSDVDNTWFTLLTQNSNPIHFDVHYSAQTEFGKPLMNSTFVMALVTGQSSGDISQFGVNLGWDEVRLPAPVFAGDTIYSESEILSMRESKSRPNMGLIEVKTTGFNQHGTVVIHYRRNVLIFKRGHEPKMVELQKKS
ncbi:MAG: MaoC family dehydratase [Bryobacteraceae bacterium]